MPNGMNYELDFEKHLEKMGDRKLLEFVARQTLDQSKAITKIYEESKANKARSLINRYVLIGLIILLIALRIIDPGILRIFG